MPGDHDFLIKENAQLAVQVNDLIRENNRLRSMTVPILPDDMERFAQMRARLSMVDLHPCKKAPDGYCIMHDSRTSPWCIISELIKMSGCVPMRRDEE